MLVMLVTVTFCSNSENLFLPLILYVNVIRAFVGFDFSGKDTFIVKHFPRSNCDEYLNDSYQTPENLVKSKFGMNWRLDGHPRYTGLTLVGLL
jgi:hypothetical protein